MNKNRLAARVKKAKTVEVKEVNKDTYVVAGSGKKYVVKFNTSAKPAYATCCDSDGHWCNGNSKTVCYHVFAALLHRAAAANVKVSFCANRADAKNLANIAGHWHRISNGLRNDEVWFVSVDLADEVISADANDFQKSYLAKRISQVETALDQLQNELVFTPDSLLVKKQIKQHVAQMATMKAELAGL